MNEGRHTRLVASIGTLLPRTAENLGVEVNLKPASVRRTRAGKSGTSDSTITTRGKGQGYI